VSYDNPHSTSNSIATKKKNTVSEYFQLQLGF